MITAGWSLAQAIGQIIFSKTGVDLGADIDTSIALLADIEEDGLALPANAVMAAEAELLLALATGKVMASAVSAVTGQIVELAPSDWKHIHISPSIDGEGGDRLIAGRNSLGPISFWEVRLMPTEVQETWPRQAPGGGPRLRLVSSVAGGVQTPHQEEVSVIRGVSQPLDEGAGALTPTEEEIKVAIDKLAAGQKYSKKASARNEAINDILADKGIPRVNERTIQRCLKKLKLIATKNDK